mmetsp:Transcript_3205/g.9987  ORF Transcript_3205/g.9987 Transcript_3205/m.9987 type:complete len:237 (+) Transcript_3205:444-1154(+)
MSASSVERKYNSTVPSALAATFPSSWVSNFRSLSSPSVSSTASAYWLTMSSSSAAASSPTSRTRSSPSSASMTTAESLHVSRSHIGLMQPCATRNLIWSCVPPEVALLMAHAASFLMSNSLVLSSCTSGGMTLASITCWICCWLPAVMLEMVQQAPLLMDVPVVESVSRCSRWGSALLQSMTVCVCTSLPVTKLPTARSAGVTTSASTSMSSSTSRGQTPACMIVSISSCEASSLR